ncbi:rod shape-determining protein RodA [bacterium]|nr:rod shape-determining protein RodA [candidate division CSSED10-310 bacterium]
MIDRRYLEHLDWILLLTILAISTLGILTIMSVTYDDPGMADYKKQIIWVGAGFGLCLGLLFLDYKYIIKIAPAIYILSLAALIYVLLAPSELGVHRWIKLPGGIRLQPSEFSKLSLILILSWWMARWRGVPPKIKDLIIPAGLMSVQFLLIILEPDLGTSLIMVPIFVMLIFASGFSIKKMILIAIVIIIPAVTISPYILKPYQMKRITSFLNPESDPLGSGYHLIQSKIAIGSGGFWGKGYKSGTQSHLDFLPVQDTDFIFAVWGEEQGFLGNILLMTLFLVLLIRSLRNAKLSSDMAGFYVCIGLSTMIFCQIIINTGMVIGLMPITGLPLPFMSYGGSAALTNFFSMSVILNVGMRRFADYKA